MPCVRPVAAALLLAGCASAPSSPDIRYLLETADAVVRAEPRVAALWAGFWEGRRAFLVYHPGRAALLVADGPSPAGFTPVNVVPGSLRGRAHLATGPLRGLDGNIDLAFRIGTLEVTAVPYRGTPWATLELLYHEAFHQTQLARFRDTAIPAPVDARRLRDPEILALLEAERRLLVEALEAAYPVRPGGRSAPSHVGRPRVEAVRRVANDYLAVRARREDDLGEALAAVERYYERIEGLATQVGLEGLLVALERSRAEAAPLLVRGYLSEAETRPEHDANRSLSSRAYGTGAAMGMLLDSLDAPWRAAVEAGEPLDALLAQAVGFAARDAGERDRLARDALARAVARPGFAARTAATPAVEEAAHRDGIRVDFVIPVPPDGPAPRVAVNTPRRMGYIGGGVDGPAILIDLGAPELVSVVGESVSLVARGHRTWIDRRDARHMIVRLQLPGWPTVNGVDPRALPDDLAGPVLLQGPDFEARLDQGGRVLADSDWLIVRAASPPPGASAGEAGPAQSP